MKIAILGAMPEEVTPLLETLKEYQTIEYANNTYYLAKYKNHELIIAYSKIGKVNSTLSAAMMIEKFKAELLLFTGVAGAFNPSLEIGDLIYATKLAQYDLDITAFGHPLGYVPGNEIFIKTDDKLNNLAIEVAKELGVKLQSGIIATGDEFICDENKKVKIREIFNADACEMEGASVALVCDALKTPCLILRSMSDKAGEKAEFDFDEFVEKSAKISANFVLKICEKL
ncbi:multifunctional 5'-methylthioadenosine / S-adenosylhomocysteine nucleosidase / 6-amino-6-deoxyfutalosine hydrolase [Campylobacter subantarcticus LMG 24377]|uniref:adenosylhomocysteine nucleosidase n=2 Tax=Campylobacter subantarcticus TaxID=497724 RepID=A0A0A8HB27_9BACT|nr:5'-methylthioadenosine / S-adenosylhomocysteine nucleosidase / 6-amino-6-deoxyfutalosine hydrolase [Campylobacter subantarcticus]EAJ1261334.1 5'-methylthioadenosine / S-adenosylhomocysteine nucleosidase / 6-amino-6-deoxyfutalosine hydrolase [Campylobacter lari]AJC90109.1 multifunctional 5'-methylthioadenosine / S-adenosylhomocysteine nucleosidase / 6-amino-6-deoxyfutalosine hydrolase [Campylobacter subantarcticus LMG 24374]AJC91776.1 multifunctional 5'-methylthioadenosine / S-adenosylhomocyst